MSAGGLPVDRLGGGAALEVLLLDGLRVGEGPIRDPHRHDYHELFWVRDGRGEHLLDGERVPVRPGTVTVIGRGQVHQFAWAEDLRGGLLRLRDEALGGDAARLTGGWLLAGRGGRTIAVPHGDRERVSSLLGMLHDETRRPADRYAADLQRHLVATLLLWLERWYDASRTERREADDADVELHRRFGEVLERDFARHHDAAHYADALGVPQAVLSRALAGLTGRTTKDLVLDRVMLEAARLLRFTDRTVGEVAHLAGFRDQMYFSRAFKRHFGRSPMAYRDAARGRGA